MPYPKFSVLSSIYIKESIDNFFDYVKSLEASTLIPNEVVLVYDGEVSEAIKTYVANYDGILRIKVVKLKQNKGLGLALREGLKNCSYSYVARLDTDDICQPDRFEKQIVKLHTKERLSVLGGSVIEFTKIANEERLRTPPLAIEEIEKVIRYKNPMNHTTVMFRKQDVLSVGSYRDIKFYEDYDLWLRMIKAGFVLENDNCVYARFRSDGMLQRRFGFDMFRYEVSFLKQGLRDNLLSKSRFVSLYFLRALPRLLPLRIMKILYSYLR